MPLESATYIHQLDPANPAAPDLLADTDNHIRLIKQAIRNTFPNVTGPVSGNQHVLSGVPLGGIIMWAGQVNAIPAGWVLCAGQTGITRSDGQGVLNAPDLRNRFVVGAGDAYASWSFGGAIIQSGTAAAAGEHAHGGATDSAGSHSHGGFTANHALTIAQMPSHDHTYSRPVLGSSSTGGGVYSAVSQYDSRSTGNTGGSESHRHGIAADGAHAHGLTTAAAGSHAHTVTIADGRPPYFALAYIMKV